MLASTWFGGLASKYECPEEGVWRQQTQYGGPWHCWLFRLQASPPAAELGRWSPRGNWQGFGWLLPGHPGCSSDSKPIWPWMPTTGSHSFVPTLRCRLPSPLSSAIKTRGTGLQRSLPTAVCLFSSLGRRLCRASSVRPLLPPPPPVRTAARHPRVISHFKGS